MKNSCSRMLVLAVAVILLIGTVSAAEISIPDVQLAQGETTTVTIVVTGLDGAAAISFKVSCDNSLATIDNVVATQSGSIISSPTNPGDPWNVGYVWSTLVSEPGAYSVAQVTITAKNVDGVGDWNIDPASANWAEGPPNFGVYPLDVVNGKITVGQPPSDLDLASPGDQTVTEEDTIAFTLAATGGTTPYAFSMSAVPALPAAATLDAATGAFSWATVVGDAGTFAVTFTVTDDTGATDDETVTFTVDEKQIIPVLDLTSPGDKTVTEEDTIAFTLAATGGTTPYAFSMSAVPALPAAATLDAATGAFSWATVVGDAGTYAVTFTVTDDTGATDDETVTFTVDEKPVVVPDLDLASPGDRTVYEGATVSFMLMATGGITPYSFSMSAVPALPGAPTLDAASGVFEWTTAIGDAGAYDVTFTVTDDTGATDDETVTITVREKSPVPAPEFPTLALPGMLLVGLLGAIYLLKRRD